MLLKNAIARWIEALLQAFNSIRSERQLIKTVTGMEKIKLRGLDKEGWALALTTVAYYQVRLPKPRAVPS